MIRCFWPIVSVDLRVFEIPPPATGGNENRRKTAEEIKLATAKKAKTATKSKVSGKSTKVTKAIKVAKKKAPAKPAVKVKAVAKAKPSTKSTAAQSKTAVKAKSVKKTAPKAKPVPKPAVKGKKATAKGTKTKVVPKAASNTAAKPSSSKLSKAPPKVTSKSSATKSAPSKAAPKPSTKAAPPSATLAKPATKSGKAPTSVPASLDRPKTPVGKSSPRATFVAATPAAPLVTIPAPTRALPKSMTVKAHTSNVLPFNPKTVGVAGYLSEAEILKQPKEKYMSKEQLAFFKQRLLELQSQLRENAGQTTEHLRELAIVPDPADRATLEEEHALELRARDRERKLLKKVEASIVRIDEGEYGYCEETGEPIGIPRLLARPTATLSIEAQERRELKQRMFGE
ncbi:MAG: RNA polymerase-binding protein DksA [Rhodocyclaceae bacterium]|nr:RNA polymerase-binding protein DksA [Rhodocyclaceae bacterium]MCA3032507.1 RNA polymerase-binding protein DksA [Rhodocyclaceae bacterium]MCA3035871.1 RNA polymerase-binding protein DksA [Rhodocyclaceae bacterium]MCA3047370.1 RNA polymerase-binding protein DksA [Rhodocyclaceae bacterium]MCA3051419.1 RNA polymerase-binding protein DksA [Rhodocyclaceae bacterium]